MNRTMMKQIEFPPETAEPRTGYFLPLRTLQDRCSFLTILKLREIKRRRRRSLEPE